MNYATLERNQCNSKQVSNYMMHAIKSSKYENCCADPTLLDYTINILWPQARSNGWNQHSDAWTQQKNISAKRI